MMTAWVLILVLAALWLAVLALPHHHRRRHDVSDDVARAERRLRALGHAAGHDE